MLEFLSVLLGARVVTLSVLLVAVTSLPMFAQHFTRTDLTIDLSSVSPAALNPDPNLKNSWGLTRSATSAWWVSDNHTGLATLYDAAGARQRARGDIRTAAAVIFCHEPSIAGCGV